jgi:RNA polymerase sigma-70 factor (ECF subfamily)
MENLSDLDDIALVREIQHSNEEAITEFYYRFAPGLHGFICQRLADEGEIEDVLSETMVAAVTAIKRFKGESRVFTWLCRIAQFKLADYYRSRGKNNTMPLNEVSSVIAEQPGDPETSLMIWQILLGLPWEYRRVLEDKYFSGYSTREIAERIGKSEKAVDATLVRARNAFARDYRRLVPELEV